MVKMPLPGGRGVSYSVLRWVQVATVVLPFVVRSCSIVSSVRPLLVETLFVFSSSISVLYVEAVGVGSVFLVALSPVYIPYCILVSAMAWSLLDFLKAT